MGLAASAAPSAIATADPIRVMVVDDSVVVRGLVSRWIEEEPGLALAGSLRNGRDAVDQLERIDPDVVILDIEMPELDGISALPLLLAKKRDLVVIMASTLTRHNAEISLKALSLGAADYIPKPETNRGVTTSATFRRELIEKIRELGGRRRARRGPAPRAATSAAASAATSIPARADHGAPIKLRPFAPTLPRVLLIGSSTGGPQALTSVISNLRALLPRVPVLITQHMPPTERRYGRRIRAVYPEREALETLVERFGINGFYDAREARLACCHARKVAPLGRALAGAAAWIVGLRADQSANRRDTDLVVRDERGLLKLSPLVDWTHEAVHAFAAAHDVPLNPLHAKGFASIGCAPCTRAIAPGEPERAGRWWWEDDGKKECGLHARLPRTAG